MNLTSLLPQNVRQLIGLCDVLKLPNPHPTFIHEFQELCHNLAKEHCKPLKAVLRAILADPEYQSVKSIRTVAWRTFKPEFEEEGIKMIRYLKKQEKIYYSLNRRQLVQHTFKHLVWTMLGIMDFRIIMDGDGKSYLCELEEVHALPLRIKCLQMFLVAYEMLQEPLQRDLLGKGMAKLEYIRDISMSEKAHAPEVTSCINAIKTGISRGVWEWPEGLQKVGYYEVYNYIDDFGEDSPGFKWAMQFTLKGNEDPMDFQDSWDAFDSEDSEADTE